MSPGGGALLYCVAGFLAAMVGCTAPQSDEKIIVSGASGQLGALVVEELLMRGIPPDDLILVSRTPEELSEYESMGASTRFGDFTQPESLPDAYAGGTRMLLISVNTLEDRPALHRNAIDAAVAAGVQHIVYTSFVDLANNTSPLAADHRSTEEYLMESGADWTMLRNQLYMNGLVAQAAEMLSDGSVEVPLDDPGIGYVAREDCAAAAAAVLTTSGHENRAYDITGSELIGRHEIAQTASEVTGIRVEVEEVESPADQGDAWMRVTSTAVRDLTGQQPMTLRDLLIENRAELMEQAR